MKKKKIIFIGNRMGVLDSIIQGNGMEVIKVFAPIHNHLNIKNNALKKITFLFSSCEKLKVIREIQANDYDILVSNGCPFVLPVSEIKKSGQLFINIHPSYLPFLKGQHPVNGVIYNQLKFFGATVHHMNDEADTGNIIYQKKVRYTSDIDLALLYRLCFELEIHCFNKAINILKKHHWNFPGFPQESIGCTFNRKASMMMPDIRNNSIRDVLIAINAFGIEGQGCIIDAGGNKLKVIEAEEVKNPFVIKKYVQALPGDVLLKYENKLLVKCPDGILKLTKFSRSE